MRTNAVFFLCAVLIAWVMTLSCASVYAIDSCIECHEQFESDAASPTKQIENDIHFVRGLSCADCHGGDSASMDPDVAMDSAKGFVGHPERQDIPEFCARCHADPTFMRRYNPNMPTDQYAKYLASQHGKQNDLGNMDIAVCTSCHGVHGIRQAQDPSSPVYALNIPATCAQCHGNKALMRQHKLPTDQYDGYAESVHGEALLIRRDRGAPHCASCHGSHEAARPGAISVGNVCAQCHSLSRDLFAKSPHKAAHEAMGFPECEVCHSNHLIRKPTDAMLGTGTNALCVKCHEPGSTGYVTAQKMRESIEQIKAQLDRAGDVVTEAAQLGMYMSDAEFDLNEAEGKLTRARAYVHSFSAETMQPIVAEGIKHAERAEKQGREAIHEFDFRRHGLWVTLGIIFLLVGGLILKIRDIERSDRKS